ncbi:MAG TPA: glycosyltransferase family 39 protein [Pyrinomonadaceae bacterium]
MEPTNISQSSVARKQTILICLVLFLFAFAVRTLTWQDDHREAWKVQTSVTHRYQESARQLVNGEFKTFLTDVPRLGHPPGYPILLAAIAKTVGESDTVLQFVQITVDAAAVVLLFLISLELFSLSVSLVAGILAALSPQFAYFSILLLPDSLIVFPILLAVYLVIRSRNNFKFSRLLIAGILIGLSCWLRANAMLLPLFIGAAAALVSRRDKRVKALVTVVAGTIIAIAPITIKNAIFFHHFIPLSLGSGQTLLEGIADYDPKGTLGIPGTDLGITRQEAQWYGKPEYATQLFGEDGIERDRLRVRRALKTIADHPVWFAGVMGKRAIASTRLDPVPVLKPESPVGPSHANAEKVWTRTPEQWLNAERSSQTTVRSRPDATGPLGVEVTGNNENRSDQIWTEAISISPYHDYSFVVPVKVEQGRVNLKIMAGDKELASTFGETNEVFDVNNQPIEKIDLEFVSTNNSQIRFVIANGASAQSTLLLGQAELDDLGPSSMTWMRYLRIPLRLLQKFFTTAWAIPFLIVGTALLVWRKHFVELALLMAVPAYYLMVQSALHTERRYVYIIHFFFLVIVSFALCCGVNLLLEFVRRRRVKTAG